MSEISPRDFGALESKVESLETMVTNQGVKIDQLLELANKSRGGFWVGMAIASSLGGFVGFISDFLLRR